VPEPANSDSAENPFAGNPFAEKKPASNLPSIEEEKAAESPPPMDEILERPSAVGANEPKTLTGEVPGELTAKQAMQKLKAAGAGIAGELGDNRITVSLASVNVGDEAAEWLTRLPAVEQVDLSGTKITDGGVAKLSAISRLEFLNLSQTPIGNASLSKLARLPKLQYLVLNGTRISDQGLDELSNYPALKGVSLTETEVTPEGVASLRKRLPGCTVHYQEPTETRTDSKSPDRKSGPVPPEPEPAKAEGKEDSQSAIETSDASWPENASPWRTESSPPNKLPKSASSVPASLEDEWNDPAFLLAISEIYLQRREWHKAITVLQHALELNHHDPKVRFHLGIALGRAGELENAFEELRQASGEAVAHYNLGIILYENALRESRMHFEKALELDSSLTDARVWMRHLEAPVVEEIEPEIIPTAAKRPVNNFE